MFYSSMTWKDTFWQQVYLVALEAGFKNPSWFTNDKYGPAEFAYAQAETAITNLDKSTLSGELNMHKDVKGVSHGQEINSQTK
jgi:hypothetical protein